MTKNKVISTLEELPNEFKVEELIEKLLFIEKVEQGIQEADEGKILSFEEVKSNMNKKWVESK